MLLSVIETLLAEDGIDLPSTGGAEKSVRCFMPDHDDKTASMSVNVAKSVYNCHGCGKSGNAWTYLTEIRGLAPQDAARKLELLGVKDTDAYRKQSEKKKSLSRLPPRTEEPYPYSNIRGKQKGRLVAAHEYLDPDGNLMFIVGRYELSLDTGKPAKKFMQFVPATPGGFWCAGPLNPAIPLEDRLSHYPIYRLPEVLRVARSNALKPPGVARAPIWLVEGEKCADLISQCIDPKGRAPCATTLVGGAKKTPSLGQHDLSPLYGQRILILADADENGRAFARAVGRHLAQHEGTVVDFVLPPGDDGVDVGDAATEGWEAVLQWVQDAGHVQQYDKVFPSRKKEAPPDEDEKPSGVNFFSDTAFYRIIGMENEMVVIQSKTTHRLLRFPPSALAAEGTLIQLAPLHFWRQVATGSDLTRQKRLEWADALLRGAESAGEISTHDTRTWGRGAVRIDRQNILFHAGDRILSEDEDHLMKIEQPLTEQASVKEIFVPGAPIILKESPSAAYWGTALYRAICDYRWDAEDDPDIFAGWLVTSLIGGALPFRPVVWLNALHATGKTFLMESVLRAVLSPLITDLADATEASVSSLMQGSSLPVYIDEFEPERGAQAQQERILKLVRVATSGEAMRTRGMAAGGATSTRPRFSLFLASVDRPRLSPATASRIMNIRLSTTPVDDWPTVRDAIYAATEPPRPAAIRAHIIRHTAILVRAAAAIETEMIAAGYPTRDAQIRSALTAGARFLADDDSILIPPPRTQARLDVVGPLHEILGARIRIGSIEMTLAEFVHDARPTIDPAGSDALDARRIARRYGFIWDAEDTLLVAIGLPTQRHLLRNTPFENVDLDAYLQTIPGAVLHYDGRGRMIRPSFGGQRRTAIALSTTILTQSGLL